MLKQLFRRKGMDQLTAEAEEPGHRLKKALGPIDVTALGIGAIIGAGIFATIGTAAAGDATRPGAGPSLILSFVLTAIACGFAALCYAEFAAMIPISGSAYTYAYATLGELVAWIIGWDLIIEYAVGNVAVAISWANYFKTLVSGFGIVIPNWISTDYRTAARIPGLLDSAPHIFGVPIVFNILAFGIVALFTIVLVIVRQNRKFPSVHAQRVGGCASGRSHRVLCLYRLRRRFDCGRGDAQPQPRSADRNHWFADPIHYSLHPGCGGVHRHHSVRRIEAEAGYRTS